MIPKFYPDRNEYQTVAWKFRQQHPKLGPGKAGQTVRVKSMLKRLEEELKAKKGAV